jgi:RHS repeat-associated protein
MFTGREFSNLFGFYEWSEMGIRDIDGQVREGSGRAERERMSQYRARAYNPLLGRFMSEDPKLFVRRAGLGKAPDDWSFGAHPDEAEFNLFRYCGNDPIDFTDPMGLDPAAAAAILAGGLTLAGEEEAFGLATPPAHLIAGASLAGALIYAGVKYFEHTGTQQVPPPKPVNQDHLDQARTPRTGKPNSTREFPDGKGGKTVREYGPNGDAVRDVDHGHNHPPNYPGDPHQHVWDGTERGPAIPIEKPKSPEPPEGERPTKESQ